tara:strand:- start:815 stop:1198 length:384 start_codon:yes stop_codon:yes gene_type:complete
MTILFVGAVSGVNIYMYTMFGINFPYGGIAHAVLFGICTVGAIMILKAVFDLLLNDVIEEFLLKRRIDAYWNRKAREEENRKRVRESLRQFNQTFTQPNFGEVPTPFMQTVPNENALSPTFLTQFNE